MTIRAVAIEDAVRSSPGAAWSVRADGAPACRDVRVCDRFPVRYAAYVRVFHSAYLFGPYTEADPPIPEVLPWASPAEVDTLLLPAPARPQGSWLGSVRRIRWRDLARIWNVAYEPGLGWSALINAAAGGGSVFGWPMEQMLDADVLSLIVERLTALGTSQECWMHWGYAEQGPGDVLGDRFFAGPLGEVPRFVAASSGVCPSSWWPADLSWFAACDAHVMHTLIGGPATLVESIATSPGIEALPLGPLDRLP